MGLLYSIWYPLLRKTKARYNSKPRQVNKGNSYRHTLLPNIVIVEARFKNMIGEGTSRLMKVKEIVIWTSQPEAGVRSRLSTG